MPIELSPEEISELTQVLKDRLGELSEEIYHADLQKFRDQLKDRRTVLQTILEKLERVPAKQT
ncbi:MAG: hypothetical protein EHM61_27055 [Acidobacteria bacterium]|nr:MAG: hypothetical protein EHM61_27055 [Acidobacteriota bacterium]